ncbi:MAG: sugar porter family MFS transporter [Planctomycetota bacterium]
MTSRDHVRYVYLVTSVAAVGGLLFGYDTAVIAGALEFLKARFALTPAMEGWAVSSVLIGCILGALVAGSFSDWLGRRKVLIGCAVLFAISAFWSAVPRNLTEFALARMLGGVGVGAASMLSPLYIAEIAPARIRGRLVSLNQLTIVLGMLVVYFVNAAIASAEDKTWNIETGWRWMFASELLPALVFLVLLFFVPESPRWLTKQGREHEAIRILTRVGGAEQASLELSEIRQTIAEEAGVSVVQLFRPGLRLALLVGFVLAILQQVTGINSILYYAPTIFTGAGSSIDAALLQTVVVGAVNVGFTLVAIWLVDQVGRRALLLAGSLGMALCLFLIGAAFAYEKFEGPWLLLFILTYIACFAVSMGPVVWVVLSEIYPTRIRGRAMSVATVTLWCACYLVAQTFPVLRDGIGPGPTFCVYGVMSVLTFFFVLRVLPETKGRTLEEIERSWGRRKPSGANGGFHDRQP